MLVCPKCGRRELGKATQCRACGAALPFKTVLDMPAFGGGGAERRCALCGGSLPVLATRCPACQAPVPVRADEVPTELVSAPAELPPLGLSPVDPQQEIPTQLKELDDDAHPFAEPRVAPAPGLATSMGTETAAEIRAVFASSADLHTTQPLQVPAKTQVPIMVDREEPAREPPAPPLHELATLIRAPAPAAVAPPPARAPQRSVDTQARQRLDAAARAVERSAAPVRQGSPIQVPGSAAAAEVPVPGVQVALQAPHRAPRPGDSSASAPPAATPQVRVLAPAPPTPVPRSEPRSPEPARPPSVVTPTSPPRVDPHSSPTRVYPAMAQWVAAAEVAAHASGQEPAATDPPAAPIGSVQVSTETELPPVPPAPGSTEPAPLAPRVSSSAPTEAALPVPSRIASTLAELPRARTSAPAMPPLSAPTSAAPAPTAAVGPTPPAKRTCDGCGTTLLPGTKFCHECGLPLSRPLTRAFTPPAAVSARSEAAVTTSARLRRLRGSGSSATVLDLPEGLSQIGRREGQLVLAGDPWVSPLHAQVTRRGRALRLRDLGSLNGVYRRLRKPQRLQDGDRICVGRQLLYYDESGALARQLLPADDGQGTRLLASPRSADVLRVVHLYASGAYEVVQRHQRTISLGREGCDINFPDDEHLSQKHARILRAGAFVVVEDLGSLNGTFVAIRGEVELQDGDELLLGNQVLRVELTGD